MGMWASLVGHCTGHGAAWARCESQASATLAAYRLSTLGVNTIMPAGPGKLEFHRYAKLSHTAAWHLTSSVTDRARIYDRHRLASDDRWSI